MDKNIQWLFFDMGGVILDDTKPETLRQEILLDVSKRYLPELTMLDIHNAWLEASKQPGSVRINALRYIFKDSELLMEVEPVYKNECQVDYYGLSTIRPEAHKVLSELSQQYSLGIMANQNAKASNVLEKAGVAEYFSHQKMSGHVGLEKPDPEFYKEILKDSGAKPHQSILIDDNWYRGLFGAKQVGMSTVLFKRGIIPVPATAKPDYSITKLEELLGIFKK